MRKSIQIDGLGEVKLTKPRSFTAISDLNIAWWTQQETVDRVKLSRLVAAAIGIAWDRQATDIQLLDGRKVNPPIYDVASGEIYRYGAEMLDFLLKKGAVPAQVYDKRELVQELWNLLPKEDEVAAAAETFRGGEGMAGSSRAEDIEGVESGADLVSQSAQATTG